MNMEETAVLLSIRPEWCQKIFRGEKDHGDPQELPEGLPGPAL